MATTMEDLDRQANEQQREEAKRNGGNGSHRPMGDGWFWRLTTTKHGNPHPHVANIGIELQYDPAWQGRFYYDELQGQLMLEKPVPDRSGVSRWDGLPRPWQDTDTIAAVGYFNLGDYPTIGFDKVDMAIREFAHRQCRVHPIRDYLNALIWDGQLRIGNWLETYCHAEPTSEAHRAYIAAVGFKWLISAVARIYRPAARSTTCWCWRVRKVSARRRPSGPWAASGSPRTFPAISTPRTRRPCSRPLGHRIFRARPAATIGDGDRQDLHKPYP